MKLLFAWTVAALTLAQMCNTPPTETTVNRQQTIEINMVSLRRVQNDSVIALYDSLFDTRIYVPPLFQKEKFDSVTTYNFFELAKETQGDVRLLASAGLINQNIREIVQEHGTNYADLLFLIDKTGSMGDEIDYIRKGLKEIITEIEKFDSIRVAIAMYGDKNEDGSTWFSFRNFECDYSKARSFISSINVTGGGDLPESVYEGFFKAIDQDFWRSNSKRMIILIGDAPPLEKPLSKYTLTDVVTRCKADGIVMNFYPIVVAPSETKKKSAGYEKIKIVNTLYPNPSAGEVKMRFAKSGDYSIECYDINGKQVFAENVNGNEWRKEMYDIANGVYMFRVLDEKKNYDTYKLILNK